MFNNTAGTMLQDVKIGDVILTYDDNMKLVETEVKNVLNRKAKCLKIKIEGRTYLVTPEHPFFTKRGLVQAKDLLIGDQVIKLNKWDIQMLNYAFGGELNTEIRYKLNHLSDLAKSLAPYYENLFNTYYMSTKNAGKKNGNGSDEENHVHRNWLRNMINMNVFTLCSIDGKPVDKSSNLIIHHIDENPDNDSFDNLIIMNRHYHDIIHKRGFNFHKNKYKDGLDSFTVQDISNYDKDVDVVNLSCEPYNTYLADGMWVHNCDSKFAWKETNDSIRLDTRELTDRLLNMCKQTDTSRVILTGGNPCLYDFSEVINILHDNDIFVDVETQGSKLPEWLTKVDQLVISPKAPSSKQIDVFDNVRQFVNREDLPLNYNVAIKIPIFNDDDFMFAQKYYNLVNSLILEGTINAKMYLSVGNTDTNEVGDISKRVLSDYNKLIQKVCDSDMANVYVLPQVHTLIWGNKQGV